VVLCGDYNAEPHEPAYAATLAALGGMRDAYAPDGRYADGLYTTYKRRDAISKRVSDYVFFTPARGLAGGFRLASIPPDAAAAFPRELPCRAYPSDHLSLVAELLLEECGDC
jgi:endonuclease/exonuclease/phosphatase family metal-dependent hydrolase